MRKIELLAVVVAVLCTSLTTKAQGLIDGFVEEKGALFVSTTYSRSTFNRAFVGKPNFKLKDVKLPDGTQVLQDRLNQDVYNLFAKYMINKNLSALINIPYVVGTGEGRADLFNGQKRVSGIQDVTLGLRYNIHTFKYDSSKLILLSGLTVSIPGDYEPNGFLSIGTGALATDLTMGLQYQTDSGIFTTLTAAYSFKDDLDTKGIFTEIPNSFLAGAKIGYATKSFYFAGWMDMAKASSGVDVELTSENGFDLTNGNLPETRVDYLRAGVSIHKSLTEAIKVSVGYGRVLEGRNVGQSNIFSGGLTYYFELL